MQELDLDLELLMGREEMYWEKVRALAVQRAHAQVHQTRRDVPGVGQGRLETRRRAVRAMPVGPGGANAGVKR